MKANQEEKSFNFNGKRYTIKLSASGEYCRLYHGKEIIYDDPACEDFCGKPADLVDTFKAYLAGE